MAEIVTIRDEGLGNSSYLVDLGNGHGLVLDPSRDPGPCLAAACRGLRLAWTAETHLHADFVSGSRELAATGATVVAPAAAGLQFPHRGLGDGDQLDLGGLSLRALATPGHTPEHLAYLLADGAHRRREVNRHGPRVYGATPLALAPLSPQQVRRLVADGAELVDARPIGAFAAGHIPGAAHVGLGALTDRPALPGGPLGVVCGHGERSMTAASLLQRQGRADVSVVGGGPGRGAAAGRPLEPRR